MTNKPALAISTLPVFRAELAKSNPDFKAALGFLLAFKRGVDALNRAREK